MNGPVKITDNSLLVYILSVNIPKQLQSNILKCINE